MTKCIKKISNLFTILMFSLIVASCSEGDRGFDALPETPEEEAPTEIIITAGAVKGPLINADIHLYRLELDKGEIYHFNNALKNWLVLLQDNGITFDLTNASSGSINEATALTELKNSFDGFGFVTELEAVIDGVDALDNLDSAIELVNTYIEGKETNSLVEDSLRDALENTATLAELKSKLHEIESLTDKISESTSFSSAISTLRRYEKKEADPKKQAGFTAIINKIDALRVQASSFGLSSIRKETNDTVYNVFVNSLSLENSPKTKQRLENLKSDLSSASSAAKAKSILSETYRAENVDEVKSAIAKIIAKIITVEDVYSLIDGYRALYHDFSIRDRFNSSEEQLSNKVLGVNELFSALVSEVIRNSALAENDQGEPENLQSRGSSNSQGLLPGIIVGDYRGFLYMEARSLDQTIDLNSGSAPMFPIMETIIHTDDILGLGTEENEDRSVYFILNGIEQRTVDGELIRESTEITKTFNDKFLEIRPSYFATPLSKAVFGLTFEKLKNLNNFLVDLNQDDLPDYQLSESFLKLSFQESSEVVSKSLGIGLDGSSIFNRAPVRVAQAQYDEELDQQILQYRMSIENFSGLIKELSDLTNLDASSILELLIEDLVDNQIDGFKYDTAVETLNQLPEFNYLLTKHPSERLIPGTNLPVSSTYFVMKDELRTTLPKENISAFPSAFSDLTVEEITGGVDSDSDGVLDNDDQFPTDPTRSRSLESGYAGIWDVQYDNAETAFMPFKKPFSVAFNIEELEGTCSSAPCISVGDSSTSISSEFKLISGPENHDFKFTSHNSAAARFDAFATVPGNYLIQAKFTSAVTPIQTYSVIIPVNVIDPRSIEVLFDNNSLEVGKTSEVQFKVTKALCSLYDICDAIDLNDGVDDFLPLELLDDVFSIEQVISRGSQTVSYTDLVANDSGTERSNLSNLELKDELALIVRFTAGDRSFVTDTNSTVVGLSQDSDNDGVPDALDFYPNDANCSNEQDGLQDTFFDDVINNLDQPACFASFISESTTDFQVGFVNETWFYNPSWHFIIRKNNFNTGFNGIIRVPTLEGTRVAIDIFKLDSVNKRVYLAYQNGSIDSYSLESQTLDVFIDSEDFNSVRSINLLGTYLLVEYENNNLLKLFNSLGAEADIHADVRFPYPGNAITIQLDNKNLISATNSLLSIEWQLEREDSVGVVQTLLPVLTNNNQTLSSGQTRFEDVIRLTLNYTTPAPDNRVLSLSKNLFVLGTDKITFSEKDHFPDQELLVEFKNFSPSLLGSDSGLFVKWYINNISTDGFSYKLSDNKFPFILPSINFELGDLIRSDVYLKHGTENLFVYSNEAAILGELEEFIPKISADSEIDDATATASITLLKPYENDRFFSSDTFKPVWRVNQQILNEETELFFPSSPSTQLKYGDVISVSYKFTINDKTSETEELLVGAVEYNRNESTFELTRKVYSLGEDITLRENQFTDTELDTIQSLWRVNDTFYRNYPEFSFPSHLLSYGDQVNLFIVSKEFDLSKIEEGEELTNVYNFFATAYIGVNLDSLATNTDDPVHDLDNDADGIPNHRDYFRNDAYCSIKGDGLPDDLDGDGLADLDELTLSTPSSPTKKDTDNDGLSDQLENDAHFTNPTLKDSDGDGYLDGVEVMLGTDPNDVSVPALSANDNDFDGLTNDLELIYNTKVNVFDTDNDGLLDWYEINVSNTNPLDPDSDDDKLSDGVEVNITLTNANEIDSDSDGIDDGIEVIVRLNPNDEDSDDNGILDADEPDYDFAVNLTNIIYEQSLQDYDNNFSKLKRLKPGTCFKTWLANNEVGTTSYTHEVQANSTSEQEVLFSAPNWSDVIRYDAKQKRFNSTINLLDINSGVSSSVYDHSDREKIYFGFEDGTIRLFNTNPLSLVFEHVFNTDNELPVSTIVFQGDILIAEQIDSSGLILHSMFKLDVLESDPFYTRTSDFSYQNSVWADPAKLILISLDTNYLDTSLIRETFDPALSSPITSIDFIELGNSLEEPLYIEMIAGKTLVHTGNAYTYNLTDSRLEIDYISPFSNSIIHQDHRVLSLKNSSQLQVTTLDDFVDNQFWRFKTQLLHSSIVKVIPVGFDLLAISKDGPTNNVSLDGEISFQTIILGDSNADSLPDWWSNLSDSLTISEYQNYSLNDQAVIPDFLDGSPNIDDNAELPVLVDTDGDDICDHWELSLFNTNPNLQDSDSDGMTDSQELAIAPGTGADCSIYPEFTMLSDPNNPDTDGDGLNDGDEAFIHDTNLLLSDSDSDGLTDYQEIQITFTDPRSGDDGVSDPDSDEISTADELNQYQTNHLNSDSDGDGLNDFEEIFTYLTNPNSADSDGDLLIDFDEVNVYLTDANSLDSDNDGLPDNVELQIGGDYRFSSNPLIIDTDGDGLTDKEEFDYFHKYSEVVIAERGDSLRIFADPNSQDTDGDLICDIWEVNTFGTNPAEADTDFDGINDYDELGITVELDCSAAPAIDPVSFVLISDSDGDRILDGDEINVLFTDPKDKDSDDNNINDDLEDPDQDRLNNYQELYLTLTDPFNADSDDNGITDDLEDLDGDSLNNFDEVNIHGTNPRNVDSDGDGITDDEEVDLNLNPNELDSDGDGLSDVEELFTYGTDPLKQDTDGDGSTDFDELRRLNTDPTNPDTDNDFWLDTVDDEPRNHDSDGDGIPDGIEVHYLRTNPNQVNSDGDLLADNYEAWVFAFEYDELTGESNNLIQTGIDKDQDLDSNRMVSAWPDPQKFLPNNLDQITFDLVDVLDPSIIKGKLYVKRYSNPSSSDSDGDGLTDSTEFEIERVFGVEYAQPINDPNFRPLAENTENFLVSNPWNMYSGSSDLDTDGDGIPDFYEQFYTLTDPNNTDSDGDGILDDADNNDGDLLSNLQEIRYGSDPVISDVNLQDTDSDGLPDIFEQRLLSGYDINNSDSDGDSIADGLEDGDRDLLTNLEEFRFKTDPLVADFGVDTDNDGLSDYQEINFTLTDPNNEDTDGNSILDSDEDPDGDSLTNITEFEVGGDPLVADDPLNIIDTDNDGLTDFQEINMTLTDPNLGDSDGNGIFDASEDIDGDGLTNFQEVNLGTNPVVADSDSLQKDADGDGIVDIYEIRYLGTDPSIADTDGNGVNDGQDDQDQDGLTELVEVLLGNSDSNRDLALDSDADGLSDVQESLITLTNKDSNDSNGDGVLDGQEDFDNDGFNNLLEIRALSDPFVYRLKDSEKDADKDFLNNLLDQASSADVNSVTVADQDGDGLLDGFEKLLLATRAIDPDTDFDGISDFDELNSISYRLISSSASCLDSEIRLSSIEGLDYCFTIVYNSLPTHADSDNDGVFDRTVRESDGEIIYDHYPLDPACSALEDGFVKDDSSIQCFASFMAEVDTINLIKHAQWTDTSGSSPQDRADILFYSNGWDKVVVYDVLSSSFVASIPVKSEIDLVSVYLVDLEFDADSKSVFMLYSDGSLDFINLETRLLTTLDKFGLASHSVVSLDVLNTNRYLIGFKDDATYAYQLINEASNELDSVLATQLVFSDSVKVCSTPSCDQQVLLYGLIDAGEGVYSHVGRMEIDLVNSLINTTLTLSPNLLSGESLTAPIKLSQAGSEILVGSGLIYDLDLNKDSETLSFTHAHYTFTEFFDFAEHADHFVGVVNIELDGVPVEDDVASVPNSVFATERESIKDTIESVLIGDETINGLKELNQYLLAPKRVDEEILRLLPFQKSPAFELAIIKKTNNRILIEELGLLDQDNDLMSGLYERTFGLNDQDSTDRFRDSDSDGLSNVEEYFFSTNPIDEDSDADGWFDLQEILNGTNPNNSLSF